MKRNYERDDVSEGIDVNNTCEKKGVMFVTTGIF